MFLYYLLTFRAGPFKAATVNTYCSKRGQRLLLCPNITMALSLNIVLKSNRQKGPLRLMIKDRCCSDLPPSRWAETLLVTVGVPPLLCEHNINCYAENDGIDYQDYRRKTALTPAAGRVAAIIHAGKCDDIPNTFIYLVRRKKEGFFFFFWVSSCFIGNITKTSNYFGSFNFFGRRKFVSYVH